ncbi:unnamed protein product, partial [Amoebophrya sp. A25]
EALTRKATDAFLNILIDGMRKSMSRTGTRHSCSADNLNVNPAIPPASIVVDTSTSTTTISGQQ